LGWNVRSEGNEQQYLLDHRICSPIVALTHGKTRYDANSVPSSSRGTLSKSALGVCAGILLYGITEQAIFGSGWYLGFLDPESLAGRVDLTLQAESMRRPSRIPLVAVIGNSVFAEGFSAKVADAEAGGRVRFANLAVPGTQPRSWYYELRAADPDARRYTAIVLQADEYSDEDGAVPMADYITDVHLIDGLLAPSDALDFAFSYRNARLRFETLRGALLKGYIFKSDVQAFLEAPSKRLERVALFEKGYAGWTYDYAGRQESLTGMSVDWARDSILFPPGVPPDVQERVRTTLLRKRAPLTGMQALYRQRWFGRMLDHYRSSGARVIFIRPPRGPAVNPSFDSPDEPSTIRNYASRPNVTVLPAQTFQSLESPEDFWDDLHMNATGRTRFSRMLAREVEPLAGKRAR
jgi:hypothetical protein